MVKKNILFVFGGKSNEHDISILSAYNLYRFFDLKKYNMFLLFIDVNGKFILCKNKLLTDEVFLKNFDKNLSKLKLNEEIIINGDGVKIGKINIDIIFPLLHQINN